MPDGMRRIRIAIAVALTAAVAMSAAAAGDDVVPKGLSRDQLFGTTLRAAKWDRTTIQVCWDNRGNVSVDHQTLVRSAVADSWEAASRVRFTGWGDCPSPNSPGLHIVVDDYQPHTEAVGRYLDQRPGGLHLNFNVTSWRPDCATNSDGCLRAIAVHEFGHVLGFTHEQIKEGVPAECSNEPRDIIGDYLVTRYDLSSVMSLCNPQWNGKGKLSRLDVQAVQTFYSA